MFRSDKFSFQVEKEMFPVHNLSMVQSNRVKPLVVCGPIIVFDKRLTEIIK